MLTRLELYKTHEYWIERIQNDIFRALHAFKEEEGLNNNTALAEKLGVTKGYVSQIMNGNFNFSISKLVDLALAVGVTPNIDFEKLQSFVNREEMRLDLMVKVAGKRLEDELTLISGQGMIVNSDFDQDPSQNYA